MHYQTISSVCLWSDICSLVRHSSEPCGVCVGVRVFAVVSLLWCWWDRTHQLMKTSSYCAPPNAIFCPIKSRVVVRCVAPHRAAWLHARSLIRLRDDFLFSISLFLKFQFSSFCSRIDWICSRVKCDLDFGAVELACRSHLPCTLVCINVVHSRALQIDEFAVGKWPTFAPTGGHCAQQRGLPAFARATRIDWHIFCADKSRNFHKNALHGAYSIAWCGCAR